MNNRIQFITNFKGFSGCKIKLYLEKENYFVRKISKSLSYNERLKKQMIKQKYFFENLSTEKITAPEVLREGFIGDLFFFDMEYVQGINLIDYIYDANIDELLEIGKNLFFIIGIMKRETKDERIIDLSSSFKKKIEDIQSTLIEKKNLVNKKILEDLKNLIGNINQEDIKQTFCHGDLTMENIIYDKKSDKYYLIDFLDTFIRHYWLDITKLFQDIEGKWYKFRNPKINLNNIIPKMNFINNFFKRYLLNEEIIYRKYHNLFLAVNFARILPYAQHKDMDYLFDVIEKNIIKFKKIVS